MKRFFLFTAKTVCLAHRRRRNRIRQPAVCGAECGRRPVYDSGAGHFTSDWYKLWTSQYYTDANLSAWYFPI